MIPQRVPPPPDAVGWTPNQLSTNPLTTVFPGTFGSPSTPAQIAQALLVAGTGIARIDFAPTPAQMATIATVPVVIVPANLVSGIVVPVAWSITKSVDVIGALNTVLSIEYADPTWAAFAIAQTINGDTNVARRGHFTGDSAVALSNTNTGVRNATGLGIHLIGSADPGNFPATQITLRGSILFYLISPVP